VTLTHEPINRNLNTLTCKHCGVSWYFESRHYWGQKCPKRASEQQRLESECFRWLAKQQEFPEGWTLTCRFGQFEGASLLEAVLAARAAESAKEPER
jgi:hypothetical protein